ncbi:MAG: hypothetical protein LBB81_01335 [Treponema sp.]|jgi:hypothetical protein|nr:hypothetical protein [Treponema sp.]
MAILVQNRPYTLAEANKAAGNVETGNLLLDFQQRNAFLDEVPWFPTTHGSHTEELRAKHLEGGEFTEINVGIPAVGGSADILKEPVKIYEGESEVPDKILQFADDPYKARDTYDTINLEGIMQDFNKRILYARNPGDSKAFKALTERKDKVDPKNYVFSEGGTGTGLTSVWLFEFGKKGFHFIYGKHTSPGLSNTDRGMLNRPAPDNKGFHDVWVRQYAINAGIMEGTPRAFMRICNIAVDPDAPNHFDPLTLILRCKPFLPTPGGGSAVLFVPPSVYGQIEAAAWDKGNASITISEIENFGLVPRIVGIPVRPWDAISENESEVPAAA